MVLVRNLIALTLAHLALASPSTVSRDTLVKRESGKCETFTFYCGHTLKKKGWSTKLIKSRVLADDWNNGQFPSDEQVEQFLFKCVWQGKGLVWVNGRTPCGNCVDAGSGRSDYCA